MSDNRRRDLHPRRRARHVALRWSCVGTRRPTTRRTCAGAPWRARHYRVDIGDAVTGNCVRRRRTRQSCPRSSPSRRRPTSRPRSSTRAPTCGASAAYDERRYPHRQRRPRRTFEVMPLGPVSGQRLALTGSSLDRTATPARDAERQRRRTVRRRADYAGARLGAAPYASEYRVHVSRDGDFTTGALDPTPAPHGEHAVDAHASTYSFKALEESQDADAVLLVHPALQVGHQCGPDPKLDGQPGTTRVPQDLARGRAPAPGDGTVVTGTEVTFDVEGLLRHEPGSDVRRYRRGRATSQRCSYQLQVDDDPAFALARSTTSQVDQPTYTAADRLYPEGPL